MKRIVSITAIVATVILACGDDEGPVGVRDIRYWDIAWSSPDIVLTDIEMLGEESGWACGHRFNASTGTYDGLILRYDGKRWDVALFLAGDMGAKLVAIDFRGEKNGWALGNRESETATGPVVLHYDGETWVEIPTEGLNGGRMKLLAAVADNDVWVSDGFNAFRFDGNWWMQYPVAVGGEVDDWVFPNAETGWAVSYATGYCYCWNSLLPGWILEPYPLYDVTAFYFKADGSGVYADSVNIPPVTERTNIYRREPGEQPTYKRIYATDQRRLLTACDFRPPEYFFFAGPNAAFEVVGDTVNVLGYVPASDLGIVRALSIAAPRDVWGVMGTSLERGPSFIVHKEG
ncbi:MAG TPA: hypothetical protein VMX79_11280 [bacterium]|nr:hypothetical protein [bacterium]